MVRAKKFLGQHFLTDENIARKIVESLSLQTKNVLEIGPGMGVLTEYLLEIPDINLKVVEIDTESVEYLSHKYPVLEGKIIEGDFLKIDLHFFEGNFNIIGNFPYNISSQILFKTFEYHDEIPELIGMFQKEVGERIAANPGGKDYGILSVLLSAYYDIEYLFTVHEHVFNPPPKVKSAVIRLKRNSIDHLDCDETLFTKVVKTAFNQRRKTLRNALKPLGVPLNISSIDLLNKRAEQLHVNDFVQLTKELKQ